jgi:hypothetical protein
MRHPESEPEPTTPALIDGVRRKLELDKLHFSELGRQLTERSLADMNPIDAAYVQEAADRLARFDRFQRLVGLLAPGGTAPRTALEQIYIQSGDNADESPIVLDLRGMLEQHWGEWTPALREAEGLPPAPEE